MKRALCLILISTIMFATVGVSVVTVSCAKNVSKAAQNCPMCKIEHHDASTQQTCCIYTLKHLMLKSQFNPPAIHKVLPLQCHLLPSLAAELALDRSADFVLTSGCFTPPKQASRENCVRTSVIRI